MSEKLVIIVDNGAAQASISFAESAHQMVKEAAGIFAEVVERSTGVRLTINPFTAEAIDICIQTELEVDNLAIRQRLTEMKDDGFVIHIDQDAISIAGKGGQGAKYGVYEFLERYLGVRWLMPGAVGEDMPVHKQIAVPLGTVQDEPVFTSRDVVGFLGYHMDERNREIGLLQMEWLDRNRNNPCIHYHHQLHKLFPPDQYIETHPHFFPERDGKPYVPAVNMGWQPRFSAEGIVDEAIRNIVAFFDAHPEEISYSFGMIDGNAEGSGFCEAPTGKNSVGLDHQSETYYAFVNRVVEGVLKVYPDKYFGLLAYAEVYDPPSFPLHPRVVPMITDERYSWTDAERRSEGREAMARWHKAASQIAWYDYTWGSPYIVPRVFIRQMAQNLRYAARNNVIGFFGEAYPNFAEGPKWWMLMKLLWNPEQDEQALLQEWCERAVGPDAAHHVLAYYTYWEEFWATRAFQTQWYANWKHSRPRYPFMPFNNASYAADITVEDMVYCRSLLEAAVSQADTAQQQERASALLRGFEYYEASVLSYPLFRQLEFPVGPEEALEQLGLVLAREACDPEAMAQKRLVLIETFEQDPVLVQVIRGPQDQDMNWTGTENAAYMIYLLTHEPLRAALVQRLQSLASDANSSIQAAAQRLLAYRQPFKELLYREAAGYKAQTPEGEMVMEVEVKTVPRFIFAEAGYFTPLLNSSTSMLTLSISFLGASGEVLAILKSEIKFCSYTEGKKAYVRVCDEVRSDIRADVARVQLAIRHWGLAAEKQLVIDNIALYGIYCQDQSIKEGR